MADISKITLPSGSEYNIKDATARQLIEELESYTAYLGVTTTPLTDGATTNPITIGGESVTAKKGNIANYGSKEFIFNGTAWQEFGDLSGLGDFAFADTGSATYTPAGSVSVTRATSTTESLLVSKASSGTATYTPEGTISQPTFTGTEATFTGTCSVGGTVTVMTRTTTNKTATVSAASSGTATYTPAGTVSAPTITVTPSTTTVKNPTSVTVAKTVVAAAPGATAPANAITYYDVSGENLKLYQIGYTTGASITTSNVTVATGITSASATAPTFTGTGARLVTGNIPVPSAYDAVFSGDSSPVTVSGTPSGTVSTPTFTGTGARLETGSFSIPATYNATFSGTQATITVNPD